MMTIALHTDDDGHILAADLDGTPISVPATFSTAVTAYLKPAPDRPRLSQRERQVLTGLVNGESYKEIAYNLDISLDTVRTYIRRMYRKLGVHSMGEAISRAVQEGLL